MGAGYGIRGEGPLLCGRRKLVTLLSAVIWKTEHMPIKLSDPAKVTSKLRVDGTVSFLLACLREKRYKMRARLFNKKDPGLASFENPQSPMTAKNAKI